MQITTVETKPENKIKLSFKEMCQDEGVYKLFNDRFSNSRFIVLRNTLGSFVVLWKLHSHLEVAEKAWENDSFVKTDEKITVTFG